MKTLILLRHGQSTWNKENRFTGWEDVDLTEQGVAEGRDAGKRISDHNLKPGVAFTSYLKRAIKTLNLALESMDMLHIPVYKSWRLNEKSYGALQGLNKAETAAKYGEDQVKLWRRGYDISPPELAADDSRNPRNQERYKNEVQSELPVTESLKDTVARILPYWKEQIAPAFQSCETILVAAHGNSLRGILMYLKNLSPEEILEVNIPTGIPYIFELNDDLTLSKDYYLASAEEMEKLLAEVAAQGKAK